MECACDVVGFACGRALALALALELELALALALSEAKLDDVVATDCGVDDVMAVVELECLRLNVLWFSAPSVRTVTITPSPTTVATIVAPSLERLGSLSPFDRLLPVSSKPPKLVGWMSVGG